jgi:hypothetical protein
MTTSHRVLLILLLLTFLLATSSRAIPPSDDGPLRLHPDLPAVLDRAWIERLALFPDLPDLESAEFTPAVWGGVVARLQTADRVLERNLPAGRWQALRERAAAVLADEPPSPLPPIPTEQPDGGRAPVWPEGPPPPAAPPPTVGPGEAIPWTGRWLAMVELGARHDVTGFNEFFSPMVQIGLAFGHGVTGHLLPSLGFYAGFGDMRGDFEDAFGDGRTNAFGFTLDLTQRIGLSDRHSLYVAAGGGYHIRSLFWGSAFIDPATGRVTRGRSLEQRDFGWSARVGWLLAKAGGNRPRFLDVGIGVHAMPADQWFFATEDAMFEASDHDTWIMLTVRFWDGL